MRDLYVDPDRVRAFRDKKGLLLNSPLDELQPSGILVRALHQGKWVNADMALLTGGSLLDWLHSRGECNKWAESVLMLMLGYRSEGGWHEARAKE